MKKAFSLIEISIVILIIGILVASISNGIDMFKETKLTNARNLTLSSRVSRINGLVAWFETTLSNNFSYGTTTYNDIDNLKENTYVNRWKDINPLSIQKNHAIQNTQANQPKIIIDSKSSLPMVNFTTASSQFFYLPDGTVPYKNSEYTVIIVSQPHAFCGCVVLGSGNGATNQSNSFKYNTGGYFINFWWNSASDLLISNSVVLNKTNIITITYNQSQRFGYFNGNLKATSSVTNRASTPINNRIGSRTGAEYFTGNIAEIIIFDRAIHDSERNDIEKYLSKKWSIEI